jgi:hypothetical protein
MKILQFIKTRRCSSGLAFHIDEQKKKVLEKLLSAILKQSYLPQYEE